MNTYHSKQPRFWRGLSAAIGLTGILLWPSSANAQESSAPGRGAQERNAQNETKKTLDWARIDFLTNRVQFVPLQERARRARISDILGIGDALRTYAEASAELRFNDGSMARIGERATFRFTPNTRNFQLTNGTALLLIPPGLGRTTIQTPNAVTGIQGSALFVRYIEETDTTIVGALTNNPDGPMILFNEDGSEQQALYANEIGVIQGDQITQLYQFDGELFWESSGLADGFDYVETTGSTDELDGVRQEIREAIASQEPLDTNSVIENPDTFSRPDSAEATEEELPPAETTNPTSGEQPSDESGSGSGSNGAGGTGNGLESGAGGTTGGDIPSGSTGEAGGGATAEPTPLIPAENGGNVEEPVIKFENSPAEEYLNQGNPATDPEVGVTNSLQPAPLTEAGTPANSEDPATGSSRPRPGSESSATDRPGTTIRPAPVLSRPSAGSSQPDSTAQPNTGINRPVGRPITPPNLGAPTVSSPLTPSTPTVEGEGSLPLTGPLIPTLPNSDTILPGLTRPLGSGNNSSPVVRPNGQTNGVSPLPPSALQEGAEPNAQPNNGQPGRIDGNGTSGPTPTPTDNAPIIDRTDTVPTGAVPDPIPAEPDSAGNNTGNSVENETPAPPPTGPLVDSEPAPEDAAPIIPEALPTGAEEVEPAEAPVDSGAVINEGPAPLIDIEPAIEVPLEEVLEALPPETISGGSPANEVITPQDIAPVETTVPETVIPETITPEDIAPEEAIAPESIVPESIAPESIVPETTIPEEIDGQVPAQLMEEAVPFPVEQVDDLPDVPSTNDSEKAAPVLL